MWIFAIDKCIAYDILYMLVKRTETRVRKMKIEVRRTKKEIRKLKGRKDFSGKRIKR